MLIYPLTACGQENKYWMGTFEFVRRKRPKRRRISLVRLGSFPEENKAHENYRISQTENVFVGRSSSDWCRKFSPCACLLSRHIFRMFLLVCRPSHSYLISCIAGFQPPRIVHWAGELEHIWRTPAQNVTQSELLSALVNSNSASAFQVVPPIKRSNWTKTV